MILREQGMSVSIMMLCVSINYAVESEYYGLSLIIMMSSLSMMMLSLSIMMLSLSIMV